MNPASPDSTSPSAHSTPEAWTLRAEWRGEPPSLAREEAGRALDALGRAAAETAGSSGTDELPPVPEALRARWAEAYGRPAAETPESRTAAPAADGRREHRFSEWLASWLRPRQLAWAGGAAAAVAVVAMMLSQGGGSPGPGSAGLASTTTRGAGTAAAGEAAPVAVVASPEAGAGVMEALRHAYPGRLLHLLPSADQAAAMAQKEPRLVVVNLGSGLVTAWRGGTLAEEFPPAARFSPTGVVSQVESADDLLEPSAPATP